MTRVNTSSGVGGMQPIHLVLLQDKGMGILVGTQKCLLFTGGKIASWKRVSIVEPDIFDSNPILPPTVCIISGNSFKHLTPKFSHL